MRIREPKNRINRIIAGTLAILTMLTSVPTTVFAENESTPSNTAGNTGGGSTGKVVDGNEYMGAWNEPQGYRFYIVNQNLERLTIVYDFYFEDPVRFFAKEWHGGSTVEYKDTTRFDAGHSPTGRKENTIDKLPEWCSAEEYDAKNEVGDTPKIILHVDRRNIGNGENFKKWFFAGEAVGNKIPTVTNNNGSSASNNHDDYTESKGGNTGDSNSSSSDNSSGGSDTPSVCSNCQGNKTLKCPTCKGDGTDSNNYVGKLFSCETCLGKKTINCVNCVPKITCDFCGRTMTTYGNAAQGAANKCIVCISNTWILCDVCGENYDPKSGCITCEINKLNQSKLEEISKKYCPLCSSEMSQRNNSTSTYYCSNCDRDIVYKADSNTIRISVPSSYWSETTSLKPDTQQKVQEGKSLISTASYYSKGTYYWSNQPTLGALQNTARNTVKSYFNNRMINEKPISPDDALYYAIGRVWIEQTSKFNSSTSKDHKQAVAIIMVEIYKEIKNSKDFQNLYYTEQSLSLAAIERESLNHTHPFSSTSLLTSMIPLSGEEKESTEENNKNKISSPIQAFISGKDNIKFTYPDPATGIQYESASEAIENGCCLVVEPLLGLRIKIANTGYFYDDYTKNWIYGSYWNLAQYDWVGDGGTLDGNTTWYSGLIRLALPNCLVTSTEFHGIKPVTDSLDTYRKVSKGREMMGSISSGDTMYGLSMHIYDSDIIQGEELPSTQTYDPSLGEEPGASPDHTNLLTESQIEEKKYSNIVKFYVDKATATKEVFVREQVPTIVQIMDEEETTGYILKDWFTSSELKPIDELTHDRNTFDTTKASVPVKRQWSEIEGNINKETNKTVEIESLLSIGVEGYEDETTLYVLLEKGEPTTSTCDEDLEEPGPSPDDTYLTVSLDSTANIVKFYELIDSESGEIITQELYVREQVPTKVKIEDEANINYKVKKWFTSTTFTVNDEFTFDETAEMVNTLQRGTGTTEEPIALIPEDIKNPPSSITLYVQLQKEENPEPEVTVIGDWVLEESEISKPFETGTKTTRTSITWNYGSLKGCGGHRRTGYNEDGTTYTYYVYCSWSFTNSNYTFGLKNSNENKYKNVIAIGNNFKTNNNSISKSRSTLSSGSVSANGFNYKFVAHRGDDKLTLASYINTDKTIEELGYTSATSKTTVTRKTKSYTVALPILLVDNSTDKYTSSYGSKGCTDSDTARTTGQIKYDGTVAIKVYSSKKLTPNTTVNTNKMVILASTAAKQFDMTSGRQIKSGAEIKFNPYVRMTYRTLTNSSTEGSKKDVYVLGEYRRTIVPNDYAEIEWKQQTNNLEITSQMWATDKMLTDSKDNEAWTGANQVLKGGAAYELKTKGNQEIKLNTYQTIVAGSSREISTITGDYELSYKQALEQHKKFKDEAIKTLEGVELVQYVNPDPDAEYAWEDGGIKVYSGANISKLKNGSSKASTDSKYYLESDKDNTGNFSRADLDIKEKKTTEELYRFYSDTNGDIYVVKGNNLTAVESNNPTGAVKLFNKTQGMKNITSKEESKLTDLEKAVKEIDQRTGAVTKLLAALDRNSGNDKTASWATSDGKWYNEAYDGIIVIIQKTTIEVGLGKLNQRNAIIDPKLVPYHESKSDMGTEAFLTQYKIDFTEDKKVATFKGQEVYMKGIENLFTSQRVYIPNMTVQDNK